MSQSAWAPNCDTSESLIYLPLTAPLSDLKSSLISQLAPCVLQNNTPLEINRPTLLHIVHIPPFVSRYFVKTRLSRDGADVHRSAISFHSGLKQRYREGPQASLRAKQASPIRAVPHFCPLATRNAGVAWAFCTFATEARLSLTMSDDDDGGRGETTKPCSDDVPHGITNAVHTCQIKARCSVSPLLTDQPQSGSP